MIWRKMALNEMRFCILRLFSRDIGLFWNSKMGSIWGKVCICNGCGFVFSSSHSNSTCGIEPKIGGYLPVICGACLSEFVAATVGPWGPFDGEQLPICRLIPPPKRRSKKKAPRPPWKLEKTAEYLEFYEIACNAWSEQFTLLTSKCPDCNALGTLKLEFNQNDPCPKCKVSFLSCTPAIW